MELFYKKIGSEGRHLIILHGLLGSSDNWQTIAKQLANELNLTIWLVDQRNHGRSPHSQALDYHLLMNDIVAFTKQHNIEQFSIIGHSMGGKVAMLLALNYPNLLDELFIVDISPKHYMGGHEAILSAMQNAPILTASTRTEIENYLSHRIPNNAEVQFILKNLSRDKEQQFYWKCNLNSIVENYNKLMDFPAITTTYNKAVYFIKGENSNYISENDINTIHRIFPNAKIITIPNANHWVHADNPTAFIQAIRANFY